MATIMVTFFPGSYRKSAAPIILCFYGRFAICDLKLQISVSVNSMNIFLEFNLQGVNKHNGETVAVKTFNQLSHMRPQEVQVCPEPDFSSFLSLRL